MMRALGTVPLTLLLALGLGGCGGQDDDSRQAVEDAVRQADETIDGVVHQVAAALRLDGAQGSRSFTICGESYAPRGVVMQNFLRFTSSGELTQENAFTATVGLLRDDGWTVDDPANRVSVVGTKGPLTLRVEIHPSLVQVGVTAPCIETSDGIAEEYADRPTTDLTWSS